MRISAMSTQISKVAISVECHSIAEGSELGPSTGTVLLRLNLMLISEPPNDLQCRLKGVLESIEPSLLEAFELEALSTRSRVSFVEWLTSLRIETKLALLGRLLSLRLISEPLHIVIQDGCSRDADSIRRSSLSRDLSCPNIPGLSRIGWLLLYKARLISVVCRSENSGGDTL